MLPKNSFFPKKCLLTTICMCSTVLATFLILSHEIFRHAEKYIYLLPRCNMLSFLTYFFQILKKRYRYSCRQPLLLLNSLPLLHFPDVISSEVVCIFSTYMFVFLPHNSVFYIFEIYFTSISVVTEYALFNDQTASLCDC